MRRQRISALMLRLTEAWEGPVTEKQSVDLAMKKALEIMKPRKF